MLDHNRLLDDADFPEDSESYTYGDEDSPAFELYRSIDWGKQVEPFDNFTDEDWERLMFGAGSSQ